MSNTLPVIEIDNIQHAWGRRRSALEIDALKIFPGEHVFLRGASGSGKSTLLNLITGVVPLQAGEIHVLGHELSKMSAQSRDKLRAEHMGVIFQMFNLLPYLNIVQNVTLPCQFNSKRRQAALANSGTLEAEAKRLLIELGLHSSDLFSVKSSELSVGQQQRVAVARALIGEPELIIADEPTSALDSNSRDAFIELLKSQADASGATILFVSHDDSLARHFSRNADMEAINNSMKVST